MTCNVDSDCTKLKKNSPKKKSIAEYNYVVNFDDLDLYINDKYFGEK